jgi:CDGSH-type Zn-finger protein
VDRLTITVRNNGPLFITGEDLPKVRLVDHEGNEISTEGRKALSICRCGASTKKPFCDGTHSKIGFIGAEAARVAADAVGMPPASTAPAGSTAPATNMPASGSGGGTSPA